MEASAFIRLIVYVALVNVTLLTIKSFKKKPVRDLGTLYVVSTGSGKPSLLIEVDSSGILENLLNGHYRHATFRVTRKKQSS